VTHGDQAALPSSYFSLGGSSFVDFLATARPDLLPSTKGGLVVPSDVMSEIPHGTTIVTLTFPGGVIMAGDRRATMGNVIANRDMEKVFPADDYSAVGIAGTAGVAIEMVRLFQVELEHYEKIEGAPLSLPGKANRLSTMLRGNLGMALQGLAVVPLFAGFDLESGLGRMFSYDVTGGCYEEHKYHSTGSGSVYAKGSLKKLWKPDLDEAAAVRVIVESLYDAADDDSATGGPDLTRGIYPVVGVITTAGYRRLPDDEVAAVAQAIITERTEGQS